MLDDILDSYIAPEHAAQAYGAAVAVVDDASGWMLDAAGTAALRAGAGGHVAA